MSKLDRQTRDLFGAPPSDDPVERACHVLRVYTGPNSGPSANDSDELITATRGIYSDVVWTGMTWGDLKALHALAEQTGQALEALRETEEFLDQVGAQSYAPIEGAVGGERLATVERLKSLLQHAFQPRREDAVARWLKRMRDNLPIIDRNNEALDFQRSRVEMQRSTINDLLDRYRECSDCGLSLEPEDDKKGMP